MKRSPRLQSIIIVYWFLLMYIIAALIWWFIALQQQNNKMSLLLLNEQNVGSPGYNIRVQQIEAARKRKIAQYIGEGTTFFVLIMVGAVFVYRATRRQLRMSMQQQNFMMAVTHELKTPIAVTRLNIETLQKRKLDEEQQQKLITVTLQEVNRLNSLCNNILLASQLDAGQYKSIKGEVDMSTLATRVIADYTTRYPKRKILGDVTDDVKITGEELLLEMLMSNLIENAIKYSPKDAAVSVVLSQTPGNVSFKVLDEGPGIAINEREKVFDKFYRVGNEETRTAKGTGLGLYLCRQIAKGHKATITISANGTKGSVFTVSFTR